MSGNQASDLPDLAIRSGSRGNAHHRKSRGLRQGRHRTVTLTGDDVFAVLETRPARKKQLPTDQVKSMMALRETRYRSQEDVSRKYLRSCIRFFNAPVSQRRQKNGISLQFISPASTSVVIARVSASFSYCYFVCVSLLA